MKLTEEDIEWLDRIGVNKERMDIILENQDKAELWDFGKFEEWKEKANQWDRLNSAFRNPIDWRILEYIAFKEDGKEPQVVRFG